MTCESVSYDLKTLGYAAHAIHNNEGTFYDRHLVFSQLGFDSFTPIEYMDNYERNPTGWVKDEMLTNEILDTLRVTEGADFIYTISVQGHGAYPTEEVITDPRPQPRLLPVPHDASSVTFRIFVNQFQHGPVPR